MLAKATLIAALTKPSTARTTTEYSAVDWNHVWTNHRRQMTKPPSKPPTTKPAPNAASPTPPSSTAATIATPKPATTLKPPTAAKPPPAAARPAKTFSVKTWTGKNEGRKSTLYGGSGQGKTTLATMVPNPIFIGIDDGARLIRNPKTGESVQAVEGIETFLDLRDALHQTNLFPEGSTIVLDTITKAENFGEAFTLQTVKKEGGQRAENMEDYGFGKGYRHLLDTMRLLISDFEPHVRRGVNILLLAQQANVKIANTEGLDYIAEAPKLAHTNNSSVMGEVFEWCDDVFRISFASLNVSSQVKNATKGKATGSSERVIYTAGGLHFKAKTRMSGLPSVVSFSTPADDSLWQFLFHGAKVEAE